MTQGQELAAASDLICPHCGYDLRLIASDRCPECGETIDREIAQVSQIPWTYRRTRGRFRTYLHTVTLATVGSRRFTAEMARPVSYRDARSFWRVSATLVALPVTALAAIVGFSGEWEGPRFGFSDFDGILQSSAPVRWFAMDIVLPASLGLMFWPIVVVLICVAMYTNMSATAWFFASRSLEPRQRARAVALAHYACAPMAWLPLLALIVGTIALNMLARTPNLRYREKQEMEQFVAIGMFVACSVPILLTWVRTATMYVQLTRPGFLRGAAFALAVPVIWVLNSVLWLGVVPWLLGLFWILFRSW